MDNLAVGALNISRLYFQEFGLDGGVLMQGDTVSSKTGTVKVTSNVHLGTSTDTTVEIAGTIKGRDALTFGGANAKGATGRRLAASAHTTKLRVVEPSRDAIITLPDTTGTITVQASPPLSIDNAGIVTLQQNQLTKVGALNEGTIGAGFGAIAIRPPQALLDISHLCDIRLHFLNEKIGLSKSDSTHFNIRF